MADDDIKREASEVLQSLSRAVSDGVVGNCNEYEAIDVETTEPHDEEILDVEIEMKTNSETESDLDVLDVTTPKKRKPGKNENSAKKTVPKIEDSLEQVKDRLGQGCECEDECFQGLNPEYVYKHRLNIADLTKEEHDMYMMGVTMASLSNHQETGRQKERKRQRAVYSYIGRRVCLDAFLYLENVTIYHLKCIRRHLLTNGVCSRVHGNQGKKPHNVFSLDLYKSVEKFLKKYLGRYSDDLTKHLIIYGKTRTNIYNDYKAQFKDTTDKIMAYTTFRNFMRKQFPNVRFQSKVDGGRTSPSPHKTRDKESGGTKRVGVQTDTMEIFTTEPQYIIIEGEQPNEVVIEQQPQEVLHTFIISPVVNEATEDSWTSLS